MRSFGFLATVAMTIAVSACEKKSPAEEVIVTEVETGGEPISWNGRVDGGVSAEEARANYGTPPPTPDQEAELKLMEQMSPEELRAYAEANAAD